MNRLTYKFMSSKMYFNLLVALGQYFYENNIPYASSEEMKEDAEHISVFFPRGVGNIELYIMDNASDCYRYHVRITAEGELIEYAPCRVYTANQQKADKILADIREIVVSLTGGKNAARL